MKTNRTMAMAVTIAGLTIGMPHVAAAGDQYMFPSVGGTQLAAMPAPTFAAPALGMGQGGAAAKFDYGHMAPGWHAPPPPPAYAFGPQSQYANHLMSHALVVAPYANYAADYSRLFAPSFAVTAWTDRVFGIATGGYGAVDGWTVAAYGLGRVAGPRRRSDSAPDLSLQPQFRAHPELEQSPAFDRQSN